MHSLCHSVCLADTLELEVLPPKDRLSCLDRVQDDMHSGCSKGFSAHVVMQAACRGGLLSIKPLHAQLPLTKHKRSVPVLRSNPLSPQNVFNVICLASQMQRALSLVVSSCMRASMFNETVSRKAASP